MEMSPDAWESLYWPNWPLATDDWLQGVYRHPRELALTKRFVEANAPGVSNLLVVDVDRPDAALRAIETRGSHPMPNVVVENPTNGHGHVVWALRHAVTRTEYARRKPLRYAAAVTEGLRRALDGDAGYSGLMTKNPLHTSWRTELWHTREWSLAELESELGDRMPAPSWLETRKRRGDVAGLGRNCAIFEGARLGAYRAVRHRIADRDSEGLYSDIWGLVEERNLQFSEPLPTTEARAIARSIHRWITTRSRMWADGAEAYERGLSERQAVRGHKGAVASAAVRQANAVLAKAALDLLDEEG
jgi:hypothetical protein